MKMVAVPSVTRVFETILWFGGWLALLKVPKVDEYNAKVLCYNLK